MTFFGYFWYENPFCQGGGGLIPAIFLGKFFSAKEGYPFGGKNPQTVFEIFSKGGRYGRNALSTDFSSGAFFTTEYRSMYISLEI